MFDSLLNTRNVFNPIGFVRGLGQAAHDVFAPQQQQQQFSPLSSLPPVAQQNMQKIQQGLSDGSIIAGPDSYIYPQQHSQFSPDEQAWNRMYADSMEQDAAGKVPYGKPPVDMSILNNLVAGFKPQGDIAEQGMLPAPQSLQQPQNPMALINGLTGGGVPATPQQIPDQFATASGQYSQSTQGGQAPYIPDPRQQTLSPFQQLPPSSQDISDQMRQLYLDQMRDASSGANANLNYMQSDLNRRSKRDRSDDFFGSVLAPIAGGMSNNVAGANAQADRWMGQAQDRRGERMNLINSLIGRQNKAQEYLQATDPNVIKNQVAIEAAKAKALHEANLAQNNIWNHDDRNRGFDIKESLGNRDLSIKDRLAGLKQTEIENLKALRDAQMADAIRRTDLVAERDRFTRENKSAILRQEQERLDNQMKQFQKSLDFKYDNMAQDWEKSMMHENRTDNRLDKTIQANADRQATAIENANQVKANSVDSKGNPRMTEQFIKEMQLPPVVRNQLQRYRSMEPGPMRNAARIAITNRYGYDPGE